MRLALCDWPTSFSDQRQFPWTDTGGGGIDKRDPTVTVTSWYVLDPIVLCVYIESEEGSECSGSAHFFVFLCFFQIGLLLTVES